jgi:ADP-ribosyl-[dinitrogen reductase] hydrolase
MKGDRGARSRVIGAMLGLAAGDALGLPVEFEPRASRDADPVESLRGGGAWKTAPGTWSDDTSLTLCLAESIVLRGFDPDDFGGRAVAWLDEGLWAAEGRAFDAGGATRRALGKVRAGMPAVLAGGRGENDNGNGALMRILPASIWLASLPEPARFRAIAAYSAVTHGHPRSLFAAWLHCLVSSRLLSGSPPREAYVLAMEEARSLLPALPASVRAESGAYARVLDGGIASLPVAAIRGSGYVVHCLEASLWCLTRHDDYRSTVLAAVNLGEDADTTAAVTGGLAGLAYGRESLPGEWVSELARLGEIESLAGRLADLVGREAPLPRSYWVLPGKLLGGGYPGRGGGGTPEGAEPVGSDRERSRAALDGLLGADVDAFLDLTSPGESIGAPPYGELLGAASSAKGAAPESRSAPLEDMSADAMAIARALEELEALLSAGKTVYLHCVGGFGRTGAVVGSFLVEKGLAAPEEVLAVLRALRAGTDRPDTESPQTEEQRRLIEGKRPGPAALAL